MTNHTEEYDIVKPMAKFDEELESIIEKVLELPLDNPIPLAIYEAGATTWKQFMYMDEEDIYEATLTPYEQKILSWFIGYVRESIDAGVPGSSEPSFYNKEDFTKYTQSRRKIRRFKSRYGISTRMERDGEQSERRKTLEEHVTELAAKVKKTTTEILEQLKEKNEQFKEKRQKEKVPEPQDESENTNEAAEVKQ